MSKSNGGRISADWGATSTLLTIKYNAKHSFPYYKMGKKIPVFVKGGAPKNNTDTSHGISVFSYGIYPTEFYGIDCLIPQIDSLLNLILMKN
jgi:hypothetical protein